jgi:transposase
MDLGYRIFFQDEAIIRIDPVIKKGWYRKGTKPVQLVSGLKRNTVIFGAMSGLKKVIMYAPKAEMKSFRKFLKKLSEFGKSVLVLDNASWHRSKKVVEYAKNLGIILYFLPPYSPELNPIEQLWKYVKFNVTYRLHADMDDLKSAVKRYVRKSEFEIEICHFMS